MSQQASIVVGTVTPTGGAATKVLDANPKRTRVLLASTTTNFDVGPDNTLDGTNGYPFANLPLDNGARGLVTNGEVWVYNHGSTGPKIYFLEETT